MMNDHDFTFDTKKGNISFRKDGEIPFEMFWVLTLQVAQIFHKKRCNRPFGYIHIFSYGTISFVRSDHSLFYSGNPVSRFARQRIHHSAVSSDSEIEMIAYLMDLADVTRTYEPRQYLYGLLAVRGGDNLVRCPENGDCSRTEIPWYQYPYHG